MGTAHVSVRARHIALEEYTLAPGSPDVESPGCTPLRVDLER
ncbi:hypothetical protein K788_0006583 [Paraburkholderia caribensis MBA4]|uniref:Uncharacterized protein n=1 Tax=Paraburkholderia caribensis MBA4 TaxID=1323664 RepID=A0A0P0R8I0_9BURK|nr:hypothetical protein K788_0006583 [Paraburkholderia caribensis MBA4]